MSSPQVSRTLIYGYGNRGRQDDALGPTAADRMRSLYPKLQVDENFQLNIEDAETISRFDTVVFVDASIERELPVKWQRLGPSANIAFSTHAMDPSSVLALCEELYGKSPECYLLSIAGESWEFGEPLTTSATKNLDKAIERLKRFVEEGICL